MKVANANTLQEKQHQRKQNLQFRNDRRLKNRNLNRPFGQVNPFQVRPPKKSSSSKNPRNIRQPRNRTKIKKKSTRNCEKFSQFSQNC